MTTFNLCLRKLKTPDNNNGFQDTRYQGLDSDPSGMGMNEVSPTSATTIGFESVLRL